MCDKAGSRLTDKYKIDFNEESIKTEKLSKAQKSIVDFIRKSSYSNIKPYVKKCAIFIAILVIDIILIFIWISYCSCCCCSCCLFSSSTPSKCCSFVLYLIAAICLLAVIIISIIILGVLDSFFDRINGLGCSAFYFLDHARYGLAPSYTNRQREWEGLDGLITKLENTKSQMNTIKTQSNQLNTDINNIGGNYNEVCSNEYQTLLTSSNRVNSLITESFNSITTDDAINDLRSDNYDAFRNVTSDDIETYLNHKYTDLEIDSIRVSEDTHLEDLPFEENSLKVTGVVRGEDTFIEVDNDFKFLEDDLILFIGHRENINRFFENI
jgi:hypothetical protein